MINDNKLDLQLTWYTTKKETVKDKLIAIWETCVGIPYSEVAFLKDVSFFDSKYKHMLKTKIDEAQKTKIDEAQKTKIDEAQKTKIDEAQKTEILKILPKCKEEFLNFLEEKSINEQRKILNRLIQENKLPLKTNWRGGVTETVKDKLIAIWETCVGASYSEMKIQKEIIQLSEFNKSILLSNKINIFNVVKEQLKNRWEYLSSEEKNNALTKMRLQII